MLGMCGSGGEGGMLGAGAGDLLVYPNRMSFDIVEGGGKAPDLATEGWHVGHVW